MKIHALRLRPGQDLRKELERLTRAKKIRAGFVMTAAGNLDRATVRLAGAEKIRIWKGPLEIVSLVGTLSTDGPHLHISFSDRQGKVFGGHLKDGCPVRTTCEIVIGASADHTFTRKSDRKTGFNELVVKTKESSI